MDIAAGTKDTGNMDKISGLARADLYYVCMHNYTLCSGCFTTIIVCITGFHVLYWIIYFGV